MTDQNTTTAIRSGPWAQDETPFWVDENRILYTSAGASDMDGLTRTIVGPGGDVGGDIQLGQSYSVSFKHENGSRLEVFYYAGADDDSTFFIESQTMTVTADEDHTSTFTRFGDYDTLTEAQDAAYDAAAAFGVDDITWDGVRPA